ncbi:TonB-dependent receptor [Alteromonas sediminis]|uniref:TonB-dependent receptor n=1 Tax=Alteromonas sediminis TaxID=2259342 RepID=A0A3N5YEU6_9ALTE|nr:TonB-dependent receptor [Alteromonas sediminis]RPJ68385.1 TonB-dependent receptor [Alteromonas sediminis]
MKAFLQKANVLCLTSLLYITSLYSYAEEADARFDELLAMDLGNLLQVKIATGTAVSVKKAPAIATVITASDIEAMGANDLIDVLNTIPGLHMSRTSQGGAPSINFRGIVSVFGPHSLLMVDGVPLKSVVRGDSLIPWGGFPVQSIERIEVIRGPGSALLGADAFSGAVNIVTKSATDRVKNTVGAAVGSFNTRNLWGNLFHRIGDWSLALNVEWVESDGYSGFIERDEQTNLDELGDALFESGVLPFNPDDASNAPGYQSTGFEAIDLWANAENDSVKLSLGVQERNDLGVHQGILGALDPTGRLGGYRHILKAQLKPLPLSHDLTIEGNVSLYRMSQEVDSDLFLFPSGALFGAFPNGLIGNPEWEEETTRVEAKALYSGFKNNTIVLGGGYIRQNLYEVRESKNFNADLSPNPLGLVDVTDTADVFIPEKDRENVYLFVQNVLAITDAVSITAGARLDDYSDFGQTINPRVAAVWLANEDLTLKALYGRAFRAPAFAETSVVNNPLALGNPNLNPETIDTVELALAYSPDERSHIDMNVFYYKIDDFITFVPDSGATTSTAQNLGKRTGYGMEAQWRYALSEQWTGLVNMAYVKANDEVAHDDVGEYPELTGYLRINYTVNDQVDTSLQWFYVGEQNRIPGDIRANVNSYNRLDAAVTYTFTHYPTVLALKVENALNDDIREPSNGTADNGITPVAIPNDLPQPGRVLRLEVSTHF